MPDISFQEGMQVEADSLDIFLAEDMQGAEDRL
jgi:hypothetical protein